MVHFVAAALAPLLSFADMTLPNGIRLHYAQQGPRFGPAIIMLHGYSDSSLSFSRVMPLMPSELRVLALDLRGHGDSDRPATGYRMEDLADDVIQVMEALNVPSAIIVGHSMGSFVAQAVADRAPSRVAGLVLIGSAPHADNAVLNELRTAVSGLNDPVDVKFVHEFQYSTIAQPVPDAFMDAAIANSLRMPAAVWKQVIAGMISYRPAAQRPPIRTLVLGGTQDAVFSVAEHMQLVSQFRDGQLQMFDNVGHTLHWERPAAFVDVFLRFANSSTTAARFEDVTLGNGVRLHYVQQGPKSGPAIIMLHGYSDSSFSFSRVMPRLSQELRVIAPDFRGHGESDRPASGYRINDLAGDVLQLMDRLDVPSAIIVGHSMGSFVAQALADRAPERITGVVLLGSAPSCNNEVVNGLREAIGGLADPIDYEFAREFQYSTIALPVPAEFMDAAIANSRRMPARVWQQILNGLLEYRPSDKPSAVRALVLGGKKDAIFSAAEQMQLAQRYSNSRLELIDDVGHALHWEKPDVFVEALMRYIR